MSIHISEQIVTAQKSFVDFIDIIVHEDIPFEDKAEMLAAYKQAYPLWPHNIMQLEEALDRVNPAYAGRTRFNTCGEVFWVKRGESEYWEEANCSWTRHDSYLHAKTGIVHTLKCYAWEIEGEKYALIYLDNERVWMRHWFADAIRSSRLALFVALEDSVNQLLIKIGALPF